MEQKVIGLLGGMSWESSAEYYRLINQGVRDRLGPLQSARCLLWSFDFATIKALQHAGLWSEAGALLAEAAGRLERGGAELLVICTNTMHRLAGEVQAATRLPLLHIADPARAAGVHLRRGAAARPRQAARRPCLHHAPRLLRPARRVGAHRARWRTGCSCVLASG